MDKLEELANLIFPNVAESLSDLENKYPKRNLEAKAMVTRFAPSPTGFLHTGSLFTAMVSKKFASQSSGIFYVRLEDTDQKREIEGSGLDLIKGLEEFGVYPDEGYMGDSELGKYGPYTQSMRKNIYDVVIKHMIKINLAYPCFCTAEELSEMRDYQEKAKENYGYYGKYAKCSFLSTDEAIALIKSGMPYVIRFRSKGNNENRVVIEDAIRGRIEMSENDQHIVIMKSDGLPTYHFAHMVDDHFMRTTHVMRGEEWLPSLPIHIDLFDAMGFEKPVYAHLPVIMKLGEDGNRRKLSKRKDPEAAVSFFLENGYPKYGLIDYLYTIANSNYEEWKIANPNSYHDNFHFTFEKMSLDGALFDIEKIKSISKDYLGSMSPNIFFAEIRLWALKYDKELLDLIDSDEDKFMRIISIERTQEKPRKDYEKFSDVKPLILFYYREFYDKMKKQGFQMPENLTKEDIIEVLENYSKAFDISVSEEDWFAKMKEVASSCGYAERPKDFKKNPELFKGHIGDVASAIRVAMTFRLQTPNLYDIMKILGYDEIKIRLNDAVGFLKG